MQTPAAQPLHATSSQRPIPLLAIAATLLILSATAAFSDTTIDSDPLQMRECPQTDGVTLYTNKKLPGCTLMTLKPLSIVPSLSDETFCFAAAEALLAGRPVVAARLGAIPELVEHEVTGLLAAPGEAEALALAARRVLDDAPLAERWGAAGRERVRERTAPERFVRELLRTLEAAVR